MQVLYEAREIYGFLLCGLMFDGAWVSFFIKPDDGLQLPEIMQWIKQTVANPNRRNVKLRCSFALGP
jgi:hypothetical protein